MDNSDYLMFLGFFYWILAKLDTLEGNNPTLMYIVSGMSFCGSLLVLYLEKTL